MVLTAPFSDNIHSKSACMMVKEGVDGRERGEGRGGGRRRGEERGGKRQRKVKEMDGIEGEGETSLKIAHSQNSQKYAHHFNNKYCK